jgi:hypothetical protein
MNSDATSRKEKVDAFVSGPQSGETHWVQCQGYRYLGILGEDGKWRNFATGKELNVVVKILSD